MTDSPEAPPAGPQEVRPACAVFAPLTYVTVTIEPEQERSCVHLHPGGQGFWIARMLTVMGCDPRLVAPIGGEGGAALTALLPGWDVTLAPVEMAAPSPVHVQDRRTGERVEIAELELPLLDRHELDELYGALLEACLACGAAVLTGVPEVVPAEFYERLVTDLTAHDVAVFADMHGPALDATFAGGELSVLKVSEDDLEADGSNTGGETHALRLARALAHRGARTVIVSRAEQPAVAVVGDRAYRVTPPQLSTVDHRGAGDSMTAGIVAGHLLGLDPLAALRWGAAAGANNVTRRGLGSGRSELIAELAARVEIEELA